MQIQDFYKTISPEKLEEYANKVGLGGQHPVDLKEIINILQKNKVRRILEVGCGTGRLGMHLIASYNYIGIDFNESYLNYFKEKLKKGNIPFSEEQLLNISLSLII
jgi:ubiquinone/menaquinone biosynthesis C-methylase UbiE